MDGGVKNKVDYNEDPVYYCTKCLSLDIRSIDGTKDSDYCHKCGCTDIKKTSIGEWEKLYKQRYGMKFAERTDSLRNNEFFSSTDTEVRKKLLCIPDFRDIVRRMYPKFPMEYGDVDTVLLFSEKVNVDSRMDELKLIIIKDYLNGREEGKKGNQKKRG